MPRKLFVANFPFSTTEGDLNDHFQSQGNVVDVTIVTDRETGRSRGFGFVEMETDDEAANAVKELDGSDMGGRPLAVRVAEDRPRQGGGRGGPGGRPGGGGGRGGPGGGRPGGGPRGPRY